MHFGECANIEPAHQGPGKIEPLIMRERRADRGVHVAAFAQSGECETTLAIALKKAPFAAIFVLIASGGVDSLKTRVC